MDWLFDRLTLSDECVLGALADAAAKQICSQAMRPMRWVETWQAAACALLHCRGPLAAMQTIAALLDRHGKGFVPLLEAWRDGLKLPPTGFVPPSPSCLQTLCRYAPPFAARVAELLLANHFPTSGSSVDGGPADGLASDDTATPPGRDHDLDQETLLALVLCRPARLDQLPRRPLVALCRSLPLAKLCKVAGLIPSAVAQSLASANVRALCPRIPGERSFRQELDSMCWYPVVPHTAGAGAG